MDDFQLVMTTLSSETDAVELAEYLVQSRWAACIQVEGPIRSVYRWNGKVTSDQEWRCVAKTRTSDFSAIVADIKSRHPYDIPEIIAVPIVDRSDDYADWMLAETDRSTDCPPDQP